MKILLSADPFLPVPPLHYGGIERIIDGLISELRQKGHQIGLVAQKESTCEVDHLFPWPESQQWLSHAITLRNATKVFQPDILHSFSRLSYMFPLMMKNLPKLMSYQRATGGNNIRLLSKFSKNLSFTGCSEYICHQGRAAGGIWTSIPNFVPLDLFTYVANVPSDAPLVFLSRLEKIKGAHRAIRMAKQTDRRLVIAGNRVDSKEGQAYWKQYIEPEIDHEKIQYIGPVNNTEKNKLLGSAAALLVPIEWDEPFGIVFIEALACGTPVISSPRGALPEFINHGEHGFLIHSDQEAVKAIQSISDINRSSCRHHALQYYSSGTVTLKYIDLYGKIATTH